MKDKPDPGFSDGEFAALESASRLTAAFGWSVDASPWAASFSMPSRTMIAVNVEEVIPLLELSEAAANAGNYVALMLSYEAAPAFDSALKTHSLSSFPLAWAAVYPKLSTPIEPPLASHSLSRWMPQITRLEYDATILKIHELITQGETYQVNYTFPLLSHATGDALATYQNLTLAQGAPYSVFLDLGRYKVLSLSPELFFERNGDEVRTKPMKGTVRRGRWLAEDKELAAWLRNSLKDKAENVMIVDLLRNDLGKVSIPGSVKVSSLFELERFKTVWQMTSTVQATLNPKTGLVELMGALFPCGSITGAPKIRTMEIIRDLERHPRGVYTGTIGLIRPGGDCTFNVAIRTAVIDSKTGQATFGVGGGITIDSTGDREYEECLVKARFLNLQSQNFDLFESILLEDGVYFLLERHLKRLKESVEFFGFEFAESRVRQHLAELPDEYSSGSWKVKLTLTRTGEFSTTVTPVEQARHWRVGIASKPVDSNDPLLFHKTTQRDLYNAQLHSRPNCDDLLFFNERDEVTESSVANVVVSLNGKLVTPPVSAGLLAGTYRNQLLADGTIVERTIKVAELKNATEICLINSVRRWIKIIAVDD